MKKRQHSVTALFINITEKLPLWLILLSSFIGYCLLATWFPLLSSYEQIPLLDIRSFSPSMFSGIAYGLLICVLFLLFILAYRNIGNTIQSFGLAPILGVSVLLALPLLFAYPVNANDIYRYVIRGRVMSVYGANPFSVPPAEQPEDPFLPFAGEWAAETSPYGPVWELSASTLTRLSGDDLLFGLLLFKLLNLTAFAGTTIILWYLFLLQREGDGLDTNRLNRATRYAYTVLWAWNPALLLTFIVDGHNDVLMIFWLLFGLLVIYRGYNTSGFLIMLLGALVKPVGILALPLIFVRLLRKKTTIHERTRFMLTVFLGGLLISAIFFVPFGSPLVLVQRLMREAGSGAGFSFATMALLTVQNIGLPLTNALVSSLSTILLGLFGLFVLWLIWLTWRGRPAIRGVADTYFGYLIQALNFRIWYATWPFPWLLLDAASVRANGIIKYRLHYGLWFLLTSQLSVLIYGHVRHYLLDGNIFLAHILGVPFTFLLPFLLAWNSSALGRNPQVRMDI